MSACKCVRHLETCAGLQVPKTGLKTKFKNGTVQDLALQVLALSREGLQARGSGEEKFLERLWQIAETGQTGSAMLLAQYENEWGKSVDPIYTELKY